jgi:hypothetical protein
LLRTIYVCIVLSAMVACAAGPVRRPTSLNDPSNPSAPESSARDASRTLVPEEASQQERGPPASPAPPPGRKP